MEGIGAEVSHKIRSAIKAKLTEIGVYVDEELPDYVMVMVANKRSKEQMDDDLQLFLGKHTSLFTTWLHQVLQKLQEVTVANKVGTKRRLSEETKKKKKSKTDSDKSVLKKKIKIELEDDNKDTLVKENKDTGNETSDVSNQILENTESLIKDKTESAELIKHLKNNKFNKKDTITSENTKITQEDCSVSRIRVHSTSSQIDDLDDEDCINIRTDGELLDTAEELNGEDNSKKDKENYDTYRSKDLDRDSNKKCSSGRESPVSHKHISKSDGGNNKKISITSELSPKIVSNNKVIDARELLNRKKASKQSVSVRGRSKERSVSVPRKGRSHSREDKDPNRKLTREDDRDSSFRKSSREDERDRRTKIDRDLYSSKRRDNDRSSQRRVRRSNSRDRKCRHSSIEPPLKRITLERPLRNSSDGRKTVLLTKNARVNLNEDRSDSEESLKNTGLNSRVVTRNPQPEEDVDAPVPSVVKVTPRPRRPPSQQPSSTLIMKAISEANKSLANMPQRPDSTQRSRKEPIFTRTLRKRERIPPEKIAVSITNQLALQNEAIKDEEEKKVIDRNPSPPLEDPCLNPAKPSLSYGPEKKSTELANPLPIIHQNDEADEAADKMLVEEPQSDQDVQEPVLQLEAEEELMEGYDTMEEGSDPQFVVTLNGYDPDGLYSGCGSHSDGDGEGEDWVRHPRKGEAARLTSTPTQPPPTLPSITRVNHSNLIEVELMKPKSTDRCKYWPACKLADKCTYYHPTKPCKMFPACKFGDACLYIHPQCKYNALCTRKDCMYAHSPAHTPSQPIAVSKSKTLYASSAVITCKFYPNCTNIKCQFAHPSRACRFGSYCTKKDCSFDHGQVAPVDKLKWTRVPPATT